jgi:hypothetical protein
MTPLIQQHVARVQVLHNDVPTRKQERE